MASRTPSQTLEHIFHASTAFLVVPEGNSPDDQAKRTLWQRLRPLERALMATDGSFTLLLAALHGEAIVTSLVSQAQEKLECANTTLQLEKDDAILERSVVLQTAESNRPVTYAESSIALSRLSLAMRRDLAEGSRPIGLLLRREALETHRTMQTWGACQPPAMAAHFFSHRPLLFRTYIIHARSMPIMSVSEYFFTTSLTNTEDETHATPAKA